MHLKKIIELNGQYMEVSNLAYEIVLLIKEGKDEMEIVREIQIKTGLASPDSVNILDFIASNKLMVPKKQPNRTLESIKFRKSIFYPSKHSHHLKILTPIFKWPIVLLILLSFAISSIYFFIHFGISRHTFGIEWYESILFYFIVFTIMFTHELGHTVAAIKYGKCPLEVGIGIYFVFPVLYTDVSSAWLLDKRKRIEINFGGLYFQSVISTLLVLVAVISGSHFLQLLFFSNFVMMLYSLNPFFKYDGYWIFSDFFALKNLRGKSLEITKRFLSTPIAFLRNMKRYPVPLLVYSILSNLFFLFQIYLLTVLSIFNIKHLQAVLNNGSISYNLTTIQSIFSISINLLFLFIIFQRVFVLFKKNINVK